MERDQDFAREKMPNCPNRELKIWVETECTQLGVEESEDEILDLLLKGSPELPSRHRAPGCQAWEDPTANKQ